jgi:hypothetical protein
MSESDWGAEPPPKGCRMQRAGQGRPLLPGALLRLTGCPRGPRPTLRIGSAPRLSSAGTLPGGHFDLSQHSLPSAISQIAGISSFENTVQRGWRKAPSFRGAGHAARSTPPRLSAVVSRAREPPATLAGMHGNSETAGLVMGGRACGLWGIRQPCPHDTRSSTSLASRLWQLREEVPLDQGTISEGIWGLSPGATAHLAQPKAGQVHVADGDCLCCSLGSGPKRWCTGQPELGSKTRMGVAGYDCRPSGRDRPSRSGPGEGVDDPVDDPGTHHTSPP